VNPSLLDCEWCVDYTHGKWTVSHPDIPKIEGFSEDSLIAAKRMVIYLNMREVKYQLKISNLRKQREESEEKK
tara:strand:- start:61 stop:279 length:219 start_codon:yes stop_codon:yes gene_type:complete